MVPTSGQFIFTSAWWFRWGVCQEGAPPPEIFPKPPQIIQNVSVWVKCSQSMPVTGAVSARSIWWCGNVWNLPPPANRTFSTGVWRTNHQTADADQTLTSTDGRVGLDHTLDAFDKRLLSVDSLFIFWFIPDVNLSVTGSFAWQHLVAFSRLSQA